MTATDELRRMLDERGMEHFDGTETTLWGYEPTSESTGVYRFAADETSGGRMQVRMFNLTPEQAIEATLGRGECRIEAHFSEWYCTGCGVMVGTCDPDSELCVDGNYISMWNYCPNCGRAVRA